MKKVIALICFALIMTAMSVPAFASSAPTAEIMNDSVSHFTGTMPVKFRLTDDESLMNCQFAFTAGSPGSSDYRLLYSERITEDSSSVVLNRDIDISNCPEECYVPIYLVVTDIDGNNSSYDVCKLVKTNCTTKPSIRITNPTPDRTFPAYRTYVGRPNFPVVPLITITDSDSTSFTCKYYVDGQLIETKAASYSSFGTHTFNFSTPINFSNLPFNMHNINIEVTDSSNNVSTYEFWISLEQ